MADERHLVGAAAAVSPPLGVLSVRRLLLAGAGTQTSGTVAKDASAGSARGNEKRKSDRRVTRQARRSRAPQICVESGWGCGRATGLFARAESDGVACELSNRGDPLVPRHVLGLAQDADARLGEPNDRLEIVDLDIHLKARALPGEARSDRRPAADG